MYSSVRRMLNFPSRLFPKSAGREWFGSTNVRFAAHYGLNSAMEQGPKSATTALMQCSMEAAISAVSRPLARKSDDELREYAGFTFDIGPSTMLFDDDGMSHREPQSCPFAGRLGSEKRIKHLLLHVCRDTRSVVADANLNAVASFRSSSAMIC